MRGIERKQIILIKLAIRDLKIPDSLYREILSERYWAKSSKDLSYREASDLIDYFKSKGFRITHRKKQKGDNVIYLPSSQQMAKIAHLRQDVRWRVHDGYFRWLKVFLKKDRVTTAKEAAIVIEALKAMIKRQEEKISATDGHR